MKIELELFKETEEEKIVKKIAAIPVVLDSKDDKQIMELIKLPQELLFLNKLSKKENDSVMKSLKQYSDTIQFLYKRKKQVEKFYSNPNLQKDVSSTAT